MRKSIIRKKVLIIKTEISKESASTQNSSALAILNPTAGILTSSSTALLQTIAIVITNENISGFEKDI